MFLRLKAEIVEKQRDWLQGPRSLIVVFVSIVMSRWARNNMSIVPCEHDCWHLLANDCLSYLSRRAPGQCGMSDCRQPNDDTSWRFINKGASRRVPFHCSRNQTGGAEIDHICMATPLAWLRMADESHHQTHPWIGRPSARCLVLIAHHSEL